MKHAGRLVMHTAKPHITKLDTKSSTPAADGRYDLHTSMILSPNVAAWLDRGFSNGDLISGNLSYLRLSSQTGLVSGLKEIRFPLSRTITRSFPDETSI